VTFDSNYPKSKSPFPKNGVWDFDDNGWILVTFKTQSNTEIRESLLLELKNDALVTKKGMPDNNEIVFSKVK
jgi:hypothetical protein